MIAFAKRPSRIIGILVRVSCDRIKTIWIPTGYACNAQIDTKLTEQATHAINSTAMTISSMTDWVLVCPAHIIIIQTLTKLLAFRMIASQWTS